MVREIRVPSSSNSSSLNYEISAVSSGYLSTDGNLPTVTGLIRTPSSM